MKRFLWRWERDHVEAAQERTRSCCGEMWEMKPGSSRSGEALDNMGVGGGWMRPVGHREHRARSPDFGLTPLEWVG